MRPKIPDNDRINADLYFYGIHQYNTLTVINIFIDIDHF